MGTDPFALLGIPADSDESVIRRAWRRRARAVHPDVGGSDAGMREINAALEQALRLVRRPRNSHGPAASFDGDQSHNPTGGRLRRDVSSFTIDALPVESHVALGIVGSEMGSIITDDPPYLIEFTLHQSPLDEGGQSWCRCDLVPEAGATTVHITVGSDGASSVPAIEAVRNMLVAHLNLIDWPT